MTKVLHTYECKHYYQDSLALVRFVEMQLFDLNKYQYYFRLSDEPGGRVRIFRLEISGRLPDQRQMGAEMLYFPQQHDGSSQNTGQCRSSVLFRFQLLAGFLFLRKSVVHVPLLLKIAAGYEFEPYRICADGRGFVSGDKDPVGKICKGSLRHPALNKI